MEGKDMVGYAIDTREHDRGPKAGSTPVMNGAGSNEPNDYLSVGQMVNLLSNDLRQLLEEIEELRSRLSPVLAEKPIIREERKERTLARCKLSGELEAAHGLVKMGRESIHYTMSQLDI